MAAPTVVALRSDPALTKQVLAALRRALEHTAGLRITIKTKKTEYPAGVPPHNVQLFVCRNEIIGEQIRRHLSIREQVAVVEKVRNHGQGIDDRAQPSGAADA